MSTGWSAERERGGRGRWGCRVEVWTCDRSTKKPETIVMYLYVYNTNKYSKILISLNLHIITLQCLDSVLWSYQLNK